MGEKPGIHPEQMSLDEALADQEAELEKKKTIALDRFDNSEATLTTTKGPKRLSLSEHIYEYVHESTPFIKDHIGDKLETNLATLIPREEWEILAEALKDRGMDAGKKLENSDLEREYDRMDRRGGIEDRALAREYKEAAKKISLDLTAASYIKEFIGRFEEIEKEKVAAHKRILQKFRYTQLYYRGVSMTMTQAVYALSEVSGAGEPDKKEKFEQLRGAIQNILKKNLEKWEMEEIPKALQEEIERAEKENSELDKKEESGEVLGYHDQKRKSDNTQTIQLAKQQLEALSLL